MVENIFNGLQESYVSGVIEKETSFYFSIEDTKKTVVLTPESCRVEDGKTIEEVDCVCKTEGSFFLKIWDEGYRPGMSDFMTGKIKSNNPLTLKDFLAAFGK